MKVQSRARRDRDCFSRLENFGVAHALLSSMLTNADLTPHRPSRAALTALQVKILVLAREPKRKILATHDSAVASRAIHLSITESTPTRSQTHDGVPRS